MARKKTLEEWQEIADVVGAVTVVSLSDTEKRHTTLIVKCKTCGYIHKKSDSNLKKYGCAKCSKNKKLTTDEALVILTRIHKNILFFDFDYTNTKTRIRYRCLICGLEHETSYDLLRSGAGCPRCVGKYKYAYDDAIALLKTKHPNLEFKHFEYATASTVIYFMCKLCGLYASNKFKNILKQKYVCHKCAGIYKYTSEEAMQRLILLHSELEFFSFVYKHNRTKVTFKCKKCEKIHTTSYHILLNKIGCPHCKSSKLEKNTSDIAKKLNLKYIAQKKFENCKNKRRLPFDVYLEELNLIIECHGIQHFEAVEYFDRTRNLEYRKKNDAIKLKFCEDNSINIIYVIDKSFQKYKDVYQNTIFIDDLEEYLAQLQKST